MKEVLLLYSLENTKQWILDRVHIFIGKSTYVIPFSATHDK